MRFLELNQFNPLYGCMHLKWSLQLDSNQPLSPYQEGTLPNELWSVKENGGLYETRTRSFPVTGGYCEPLH